MSTVKKIVLAIVAVPVLFIVYLVISSLLSPLFDDVDKERFESLKSQSLSLYDAVKNKSAGTETWIHEATCEPQRSGWMIVSGYVCVTFLRTEVPVTAVSQVNALHEKYYPVINTSASLKQKTELSKQLAGQFGVDFVVSSAEQHYTSSGSKSITCTYLAALRQADQQPVGFVANDDYGADIARGDGLMEIGLRCTDIARGNWYGPADNF